MRKIRSHIKSTETRKVACTVSAAALMLGVTSAATIGLKFTVDYCGFPNYVNYVNAPAFGVPMNEWQNLTAMGTGYHTCSGTTFFSLNEVIDTTTSSGGLHPLPNGSLTLNWSGQCANWSGFRGYDSGTPPQPITSGPPVPEAQVYAGFIRDGVNFGPGSSGGDNNQPGYSVDIVGLKSVFTNGPFAVQLIASSDSMQYLTNAFIIDATLNSTQSVIYPNPQLYANVGDTPWFRSIGGGLSTGSGSVDTDHLKIVGNRAAHSGGPPAFNFASTLSGAILTDKPVISMRPNPVVVCAGDSITWSGYAVGVPPLAYQWRHNGSPIPGATNTSYTLTNITSANRGSYDLVVSNLYGLAVSPPLPIDQISTTAGTNFILDTNPSGPEHDALAYGPTWLASSGSRTGVMSFNAAQTNQIVVPGATNFDSTTGTVMFWMRSSGVTGTNEAMLFDRRNPAGCILVQSTNGIVRFEASSPSDNEITSLATNLSDNNWHLIALAYDQGSGGECDLYVDGQLDSLNGNSNPWSWTAGEELEFGLSHDASLWAPYNGQMDDLRFYNRVLTATEIASVFSSGALVDTNALVMRLNFDAAPGAGATLRWQCPDAILQSSDSVNGPFNDIRGALSPYPAAAHGAQRYYRYHGHSPASLVSNPYLM